MQSLHGFQRPDGTFEALPLGRNHSEHAMVLGMGLREMFYRGYMRTTYIGNELYVNNPVREPTDKQRRLLVIAAMENELTRVVFDNDHRDCVLWDVNNR